MGLVISPEHAVPRRARLQLSVAPEVNRISPGSACRSEAIVHRLSSSRSRAARPSRPGSEGLPKDWDSTGHSLKNRGAYRSGGGKIRINAHGSSPLSFGLFPAILFYI